ncbi:hypothetical protein Lalb_Chr20g0114751 [Lupinus albus]|uniref:Uncharacterized protein n=1 Tax=Lupinus albus TaxID=3870 RepID=A0A6A4NBQ3_LUPAL|nr:hypothetical protein Lalb_Chr20g0114751 [Lupinus albus]
MLLPISPNQVRTLFELVDFVACGGSRNLSLLFDQETVLLLCNNNYNVIIG